MGNVKLITQSQVNSFENFKYEEFVNLFKIDDNFNCGIIPGLMTLYLPKCLEG
jgi:hypothetical protein